MNQKYMLTTSWNWDTAPADVKRWLELNATNMPRLLSFGDTQSVMSAESAEFLMNGGLDGVGCTELKGRLQDVSISIARHNRNKITRIKMMRGVCDLGLREAKELVENMELNYGMVYEIPKPYSNYFTEGDKKAFEEYGFRVTIKPFDIMPDNLFTL